MASSAERMLSGRFRVGSAAGGTVGRTGSPERGRRRTMPSRKRGTAILAAAMAALIGLLSMPQAVSAAAEKQAEGGYAPTMVVLDASGSMTAADPGGGTKIAAAKRAVHGLVDSAPADSRVGLAVYGTGTGNSAAEKAKGCQDIHVLRGPEPIDKQEITGAVDRLRPSGYTPIGRSLQVAAKELPEQGPRSVVLVSDGEDTCAPPDPCEVAKQLADAGIDLVVHAVGFSVDEKARKQLTCIAQSTGGTYTEAPDAGSLERSLPRVTAAALRNYEPAGTPVRGGESPSDASALKPGQYLDTVHPTNSPDDVQFYSVEAPRGSTIYLSGTVPEARDRAAKGAVQIESIGPGGQTCDKQVAQDTAADVGGVATARLRLDTTDSDYAGCEGGGTYTFGVYYRSQQPDAARKPLELLVGLEPGADTAGLPPATSDAVPFEQPAGKALPVTGGGSFGTAATLDGSGRYTDGVRYGEFVFYRVRVDWGQAVKYRVHLGASPVGGQTRAATVLYSPSRQAFDTDAADYSGDELTLDGVVSDDGVGGIPVRYLNRDNLSADDQGPSLAGWYYIGFRLDPSARGSVDQVPVTLDVSVAGDREAAPYRSDVFGAKRAAPTAADTPGDQSAGEPADVAGTTERSPLLPWLAGGAAVVGLLIVLIGVLVHRRRRGLG
ncbi:MAG: VWA domain-containing protein [Pseudonocardiaceae bacterium]|nr:VWA domain-containing protein [Pseudonocardiaceae bacterium]